MTIERTKRNNEKEKKIKTKEIVKTDKFSNEYENEQK